MAMCGQEKDPKTGKEAFRLPLWESGIVRWLTTAGPMGEFAGPYPGVGNDPVCSYSWGATPSGPVPWLASTNSVISLSTKMLYHWMIFLMSLG